MMKNVMTNSSSSYKLDLGGAIQRSEQYVGPGIPCSTSQR